MGQEGAGRARNWLSTVVAPSPSSHRLTPWAALPPGAAMVPTGWTTMQCPETSSVEKRKVARVGA